MIIEGYGIRLERLQEADIELVREKRNSPAISQFMEYREHITPEMQKKWFQGLHPTNDFYFVIHCDDKKVGLIHTSDIHWQDKTANSGLFVWEKNYLGTHAPVMASLGMLDVFMGILGVKYYYAKVLNTNEAALTYNANLGFEEVPGQATSRFKTLLLTKKNYIEKGERLRQTANRLAKRDMRLELGTDLTGFIKNQGITIPDTLLGKPLMVETKR